MRKFEYIRVKVDIGDLAELNQLSSVGFRVVAIIDETETFIDEELNPSEPWTAPFTEYTAHYALLERELL